MAVLTPATPEKDPLSPATKSFAYDVMAPRLDKVNALLGGTEGMRKAGQRYLPMHDNETQTRYDTRLCTSFLLNMFELTLNNLASKPFGEPIKLDDMPDEIKELMEDVDLQGNDLQVFARNWFKDGVANGLSHVLVDFPSPETQVDGEGNEIPRTREDDLNDNLRPSLIHIPADAVIFASSDRVNGQEFLTEIRIAEDVVEIVGFAEMIIPQIRQLKPGLVVLYRQSETEKDESGQPKWVEHETSTYDLNFIPFVTFYAERESFMIAQPPLTPLCDLNIAHWQSGSDQRNILTAARFPILAVSGGTDEDNAITIGPWQALWTPDPSAKWYYVEHNGAAISAGDKDLQNLEDQMSSYGSQFLTRGTTTTTATQNSIENAETNASLQDMAQRFQDALNNAIAMMGIWVGVEDTGEAEINLDFLNESGAENESTFLIEMRKGRDISRTKLIEESVRVGLLAVEFDTDENDEQLEEEAANSMEGFTDVNIDPQATPIDVAPSDDPEPANDDNGSTT